MTTAPDILCVGSVHWDDIGRSSQAMSSGADVPGRINRLPGGVAMNVAMTLRRLGRIPTLLTAIGRDPEGDELIAVCERLEIGTECIFRCTDHPTDRYLAIEDVNGLVGAIADTHSLEAAGDKILEPLMDGRLGSAARPWPGLIVLDGNLTASLLADVAIAPYAAAADLRIAPASPGKVEHLRPLLAHARATLYLNLEEAGLLGREVFADSAAAAEGLLACGARRVLVTDGQRDCSDGKAGEGVVTDRPRPASVQRITGAGDTFMAAHIVSEQNGASRAEALEFAHCAASDYVAGEIGT